MEKILQLYLQLFVIDVAKGAGLESDLRCDLEVRFGFVGVATGRVDILRFTGVGRQVGRTALACSGRQRPAEGVDGAVWAGF